MPHRDRHRRRHDSWIWRVAVAIAMAAQCWIAGAPLTEAHGVGMASHVEAPGATNHFTHDEAACAVCQLLATPVLHQAVSTLALAPTRVAEPIQLYAQDIRLGGSAALHDPRAPPLAA